MPFRTVIVVGLWWPGCSFLSHGSWPLHSLSPCSRSSLNAVQNTKSPIARAAKEYSTVVGRGWD